jgi:dTDP-4-dehydrorhamnose 3,5-epimerase
MKFIRTNIPEVIVIEPKVAEDVRGFFLESFREDLMVPNGMKAKFVQDNHSHSSKGVLRGLHYQITPMAQAKLVRVTRGEVYDVAVDIRRGSKTFGQFVAVTLNEENKRMLYVPEGFAHGFVVTRDHTDFVYKCTNYYSQPHERGILWNDSLIGIPWPKLDVDYILSEKDKKLPPIQEFS